MKQNILIIGPIGDIGGRELETGFIANTLSEDYNVTICSTANYTSKSQIFDFVSKEEVISLNEFIFNRNLWFKLLAVLGYLKSSKRGLVLDYVSNSSAKKTGYRNYALKQIKKKIDNADAVIICAQISSNYINEVLEYASSKQKPTLFRTSNTIKKSDINHNEWLDKVTLFAHHSLSNAKRLAFLENHNYQLIDQCTFKEDDMLKIEPTKKFKSLLYIGRLSSEKGISELVGFFKNYKLDLNLKIIGDGQLYDELKIECRQLKNVELLGFLNQDAILDYINQSDAIIITSHEESGPLVGLEAMASARLVISAKVGAMPDRLSGCKNQFWFDINNLETLEAIINHIKKLDASKIKETAIENRKRYINKYRKEIIQNQYKNAIFKLLKK
jgi:glycosyltransferase involved in cell wall biosynthesis